MKSFSQFVVEKKKQTRDSIATTVVSSPLRGQNQDQSGFSPSQSTADYTISDSKKIKIKEGFTGDSGSVRQTPVTMKSAGKSHVKGGSHLQHDADSRRVQLDKVAQQRKEQQKIDREKQQADRQKTAMLRQKKAQRDMKTNEDSLPIVSKAGPRDGLTRAGLAVVSLKDKIKSSMKKEQTELDEAKRGRPPKNKTEEDPGSDNIIMQLRKVITLRGQKPVTYVDGKQTIVSPSTAHRLLAIYDNLKTTGEKHTFSQRIHKSAESMRDVVAGKKQIIKPKISLGGSSHKDK